MSCVDLRDWARTHRYRWRYEESYRVEKDPATRGDGRWYVEILCRRGLIYPWGGGDLLASTDTRGVRERLLAIPGTRGHQRGDRESVVRFPSRLLDQVAAVLTPKRLPGRADYAPPIEVRERGLAALCASRSGPVGEAYTGGNSPGTTKPSSEGGYVGNGPTETK